MDPAALAARIESLGERPAGSNAERNAALMCAGELWNAGRRPRTETIWFRRQRALPRALYAVLGVAASVVAVDDPQVGLGLALGALVALLVESAGVPIVSLLQVRRATQNVVAPSRHDRGERVLLVLTASVDGRRRALMTRWMEHPALARVPGPPGLLAVGLALIALCAGLRIAGAEGTPVGALQLVPSILVLLLMAGFVDEAFAPVEQQAPGAAAAISLAAAIDARPPRGVVVELLIAGAGEAGAAGIRAYVRERRKQLSPEAVVVVHLGSAGGPLRYVVADGELLPYRLHPRLIELAKSLPDARPARGHSRSGARVARGARWPAIALEGEARPLATAALRLIAAIDRELN
jgi:hypothetical protein